MLAREDDDLESLLIEFQPSEDDRPGEWMWRVGTSYGIHVYALHPTAERDGQGRSSKDVPIFSVLGEFGMAMELASQAVHEHNRAIRQNDDARYDGLEGVTEEELRLASEQAFDMLDGVDPDQLELPFTRQIEDDVQTHTTKGD